MVYKRVPGYYYIIAIEYSFSSNLTVAKASQRSQAGVGMNTSAGGGGGGGVKCLNTLTRLFESNKAGIYWCRIC